MYNKSKQIENINHIVASHSFTILEKDYQKPWGAYFRLINADAEKFIDTYFANTKNAFSSFEGLSPKFLLVEPNKRLSWQYHYRRAEIWRVLEGPVGIKLSDTDVEPSDSNILEKDEIITFEAEKRHRLIGLGKWGVVAEIWQHTDLKELSDESDIVRVTDDFGR